MCVFQMVEKLQYLQSNSCLRDNESNEAVNPASIPGVTPEHPETTAVELRSLDISNGRELDTNFPLESPATESTRMDQSPVNLPPLRRSKHVRRPVDRLNL